MRPSKSPSKALPYGSSSSLLGSQRCPCGRLVRPVHAVAVALTGADGRQVGVPDVAVDLVEPDPGLGAVLARSGTGPPPRRPRRTARSWCPRRRRWHPAGTACPATPSPGSARCPLPSALRASAHRGSFYSRPSFDPIGGYPRPPVAGGALGSVSVPALTPEQIGAIDAAHVWHPYASMAEHALAPPVAVPRRARAADRWPTAASSSTAMALVVGGDPRLPASRCSTPRSRDQLGRWRT